MGESTPERSALETAGYRPCDTRYRTSKYFLDDQLRCSEAVTDFQSIRSLIDHASDFTTRRAFCFQTVSSKRC